MIEARAPKYRWGQKVLALVDLYNDGSYPEREAETLHAETARYIRPILLVQVELSCTTELRS